MQHQSSPVSSRHLLSNVIRETKLQRMKLTGDVENMCLDARRKLANVANVCAGVGMEGGEEGVAIA